MKPLELLLSRRWILKSRDKDLYYQMKDEVGKSKKFLTEKLGYQVIVNPSIVKVEKLPAMPESWMGILEFAEQIEYAFFCLILMFLEDKEAEEQFVLSELTEYVQSQYKEEEIDWTVYSFRRHLIKVMKYCVNCGMLEVDDGSEESFARSDDNEVLYENTGASRFFMRNFTRDIMGYTKPEDFIREEWIDMDEDRGIIRRQRVYRRLLMSMGIYKTPETEEDFAYIRNYRNLIQGELEEQFDCELQVHRTSAYLVLGESAGLGKCFPEEHTLSDIVLLCNHLLIDEIKGGNVSVPPEEQIYLPNERFRHMLERCKRDYGHGWVKSYREMTTEEFCRTVTQYMLQMEFIAQQMDRIQIRPVVGKICGRYPEDFNVKEQSR